MENVFFIPFVIFMILCGGGAIVGFFIGLFWAIADKIAEKRQKKNGTYDPDEPLWYMKSKKAKA